MKLYFSTEQGLLGAPFGLPPTAAALDAYLEILGGCDLPWAVSAVGGDVVETEVARLALDRGGHIHLGLEFYRGDRQPTNVELVTEAVELCQKAQRPVATPDQAAAILRLPRPRLSSRTRARRRETWRYKDIVDSGEAALSPRRPLSSERLNARLGRGCCGRMQK